jgi:hypothetical protein
MCADDALVLMYAHLMWMWRPLDKRFEPLIYVLARDEGLWHAYGPIHYYCNRCMLIISESAKIPIFIYDIYNIYSKNQSGKGNLSLQRLGRSLKQMTSSGESTSFTGKWTPFLFRYALVHYARAACFYALCIFFLVHDLCT